jgi:ribosomal protein S18 acetylase RimI-like enzyme
MNGRQPFPELVMRPVDPADVDAIVATHRRLSPQSIYRRFFTLMPDPASLVMHHLALVDHRDHEALVVLDGDQVVAVAQWDRAQEHPEEADVAIVVDEAWQHRGLGTALMRALAGDAHRHGVDTLTASVLSDNRAGFRLANHNRPAKVDIDGPEVSFRFDLAS